jgi:nucleotide-binding universal stress UspA family protein
MFPAKKIVCPTDFSDGSLQAIAEASELALQSGAEVYLLHVLAILPPPSEPGIIEPQTWRHEEIESELRKLATPLTSRGIRVQFVVANGEAAETIVRTAQEVGADLIVIATHGNTGWRHLAFGSVTERVVRLASCPVLTIRMSTPQMVKNAA